MPLNRDLHEKIIKEVADKALDVCLVRDADLDFRWLLRRKLDRSGPIVVFIGMNPSSATKLATAKEGGDKTTEKALQEFDFDHLPGYPSFNNGLDALPVSAGEIRFLNLLPIVEGTSTKVTAILRALPSEDLEWLGQRSAQLIADVTEDADVIIPVWGAANAWKTVPLETVLPVVEKRAQDPRKQVWAVRNDSNTPRHLCPRNSVDHPWAQEMLENFPFN